MEGQQTWDPFEELHRIQDKINKIFGAGGEMGTQGMQGVEVPSVDVQEHGNDVIVTADMPGLTKDEIRIDVTSNNILEISGQKNVEEQKEQKGFVRHERSYTGYYRAIRLPAEVDKTKAKATYNNGVLNITLPVTKKPEEKKSEIPVS
jgi:HSP20 family protein